MGITARSRVQRQVAECEKLMGESALFAGLSRAESLQIVGSARTKLFSRKQVIFSEGEAIREVLVIEQGCMKLTQLSRDGSEVILRLSGRGDLVGVLGLSASSLHTCSAHALEAGSAYIWEAKKFEEFLERCPAMRRNVATILADRLKQ